MCNMLLTQKSSVEEMVVSDIRNAVYQKVDMERQWQVELIELLLLEREQEGLEDSDLEWLEWLCTHQIFYVALFFLNSNMINCSPNSY